MVWDLKAGSRVTAEPPDEPIEAIRAGTIHPPVIAFGGAMLLTSTELSWRNTLVARQGEAMQQVIRQVGSAAAGAQVLVGLASIVLGILGLVGMTPTIMILVALLATGALVLLRSSVVGGLMLEFLRR